MNTIKVNHPGVQLIAHRGCSGLEKENTCAAFVAAGNRSYFGIETDIHRTADGQYIVIHDDNAKRVSGSDIHVEGSTFEALRRIQLLDRADAFSRRDLIMPSLQEYLQICRQYEKTCVLELKNHFEQSDIENVIQIIRDHDWLDQVIFISFDLANCVCVRQLLPEQRVQFLTKELTDEVKENLLKYALDLDMYYKNLTAEDVASLHADGIKVNVWTVNTAEDAERMIGYGVDFITSNIVE